MQKESSAIAREFDASIKGNLNVLGQFEADVQEASVRSHVVQLKETLSDESQRIQGLLTTSYNSFALNPCGLAKSHGDLLASINASISELNKLTVELTAGNKTAQAVNTALTKFESAYDRGRIAGARMGKLMSAIQEYKVANGNWPADLRGAEFKELVATIGESNLSYRLDPEHGCVLTFSGQDGVLNTTDDKVHYGKS